MRIVHATPENSKAWNFLGLHYTRVGQLVVFRIGRLIVYRRIFDLRSFAPCIYTKP